MTKKTHGSRPGKPGRIVFEDGTKVTGDNLVIDGKDQTPVEAVVEPDRFQKRRDASDALRASMTPAEREESDTAFDIFEVPRALVAPQPTQAERVFASANKLLTHFSPDAANVQLQVQASPDVTFLRLAEYLRCYASCLLAAAQAEQDRKE